MCLALNAIINYNSFGIFLKFSFESNLFRKMDYTINYLAEMLKLIYIN